MTEQDIEYLQSYKLVILGDVAVGKSSIVQRFINGTFNRLHQPTIGALFQAKQIVIDGNEIKFEIWDTAGQERFYSLTRLYYKNAKAAIVVFDWSNASSFERAQKWVGELLEKASPGVVIVWCGNKVDLEDRQVKKEDAEKYAESIGSLYIEVSAKLNLNIEEIFKIMVPRLPKTADENVNQIIIADDKSRDNAQRYRDQCNGYC